MLSAFRAKLKRSENSKRYSLGCISLSVSGAGFPLQLVRRSGRKTLCVHGKGCSFSEQTRFQEAADERTGGTSDREK